MTPLEKVLAQLIEAITRSMKTTQGNHEYIAKCIMNLTDSMNNYTIAMKTLINSNLKIEKDLTEIKKYLANETKYLVN